MTDLISRQAAIEALHNMMDTDGFRNGWAVSRANVKCMLEALPSIEPEGKQEYDVDEKPTYKFCPNCGVRLKFCPNCGVRLKEE